MTWTCKEWDVIQIVYVIFSVLYDEYDEYATENNHATAKTNEKWQSNEHYEKPLLPRP